MRQTIRKISGVFALFLIAALSGLLCFLLSANPAVAALSTPVVEIQSAIGGTGSINLACKVVSDGGQNLNQYGMEVRRIGSTWGSPAVSGFSSEDKTFFSITKSGLDARTVYEARAFVSYLSGGIATRAYTGIIQVMTRGPAGIRDLTVVSTTTDSATFSVNLVDDGNAPPVVKFEFFVKSIVDGSTVAYVRKIDTGGYPLGVHTLTTPERLLPNTEYDVQVYVTNNFSAATLPLVRFRTKALPPAVSTSTTLAKLPVLSDSSKYVARMYGEVSADNGAAVTERGFVYGVSSTPTLQNSKKVTAGTGTGSFSAATAELNKDITYYYRAYATNSGGTSYGSIRISIMLSPTATPAPTATLAPRPTASPTPPVKPSATPTPTKKPAATATPSPTPTSAAKPSASPAPSSATPLPSASPTPTATTTASPTPPVTSPGVSPTGPAATGALSPAATPSLSAETAAGQTNATAAKTTDATASDPTASGSSAGETTAAASEGQSTAGTQTGTPAVSGAQSSSAATGDEATGDPVPAASSANLWLLLAIAGVILFGGTLWLVMRKKDR